VKAANANRTLCYSTTCAAGNGLYNGDCTPCRNDRFNAAGGDSLAVPCAPCAAMTQAAADKMSCAALDAAATISSDYSTIAAGVVGQNLPWGSLAGLGGLALTGERPAAGCAWSEDVTGVERGQAGGLGFEPRHSLLGKAAAPA
jgi:hypothetical protein